jgi:hypothetical protein
MSIVPSFTPVINDSISLSERKGGSTLKFVSKLCNFESLKNLEFDNADFGTIGLESCFGALNKLF